MSEGRGGGEGAGDDVKEGETKDLKGKSVHSPRGGSVWAALFTF